MKRCEQCEQNKVWARIVREAREQAEQEPMLASFYHATIIKHDSLAASLSYILANKLKTPSMPAMAKTTGMSVPWVAALATTDASVGNAKIKSTSLATNCSRTRWISAESKFAICTS